MWQLAWDEEEREFKSSNSSVFVFQDRSSEDLPYIQTVIKNLAGDGSLDDVFDRTIGLLDGNTLTATVAKGEVVVAKGEPKGEIAEPLVKMEVEDVMSDEEDSQDVKGFIDDDEDGEENDDYDEEEDYEGDSGDAEDEDDIRNGDEESKEVEMCDRCGRAYQKRAHFLKHLQQCNPGQIGGLPPKYTLREQAKMKTEDGRSSKESVEKRLKTLAKSAEECNRCERSFKHRSFLIHHLKACNPDQIPQLVTQKMSAKVAKRMKAILADDSTLQCQYCPRKFTFKKAVAVKPLLRKPLLREPMPRKPMLRTLLLRKSMLR